MTHSIKTQGHSEQSRTMKKSIRNSGFMVIEILIAASIITVSILAAMTITQKSVYVSRQAFHTTQAAFLLEEGAEAVRVLRDNAWINISGLTAGTTYYPKFSSGTWTLTTTSSDGVVGIFTRTVTLAAVCRNTSGSSKDDIASCGGSTYSDSETKLVTVTVSWLEGATTIAKTLQFYIIDIFS